MERFGLILVTILAVSLAACAQSGQQMAIAACIDGWEIAQLREACLGPADPSQPGAYDPAACREVRVNLTCDDPSTGTLGVLMLPNPAEGND